MNNRLEIRRLKAEDEEAFYCAYQEVKVSADFNFVSHYKEGMPFSRLLKRIDDFEQGLNLPQGYVPCTLLFGFVGPKIVGRVMIRHRLNEFLRNFGGHIGYGVVPSERRKGFGSQLLQESLPIAQTLGINNILVTCDSTNLPSRKIIEGAGGVFERISKQKIGLPDTRLYWISL